MRRSSRVHRERNAASMHFRLRLRSRPELLGRGAPDHTTVFTVSLCDSLVSREGRYISALTDGQTKLMLFDTKTKQLVHLEGGANRSPITNGRMTVNIFLCGKTWAGPRNLCA